jgi:hypothetical protein
MHKVVYANSGVTVEDVADGQTLLNVSIRRRVPHHHQCGGQARCTTCRVQVLDAGTPPSLGGGLWADRRHHDRGRRRADDRPLAPAPIPPGPRGATPTRGQTIHRGFIGHDENLAEKAALRCFQEAKS